ncbi:GNAT family N-acetyltransferase [Companilactobacillus baiquanensis]|uniref:GNAT family N-acetyltransferase n=1 Tax=Companilactobacillus baiquanensis TaxID=2486005 RepID=A0ABW1UYP6_9LACO|nr:GNAT family N-acetyltransferase [Companilactobacillus baiquanensis]
MIEIKYSNNLNSNIYQDDLMIRKKVFVDEQKVPASLEVDKMEKVCIYATLYIDEQPAATARYFPTDDNGIHIQRVAVLKKYRKQGLASLLLKDIFKQVKKDYQYIILGAQDQAQNFYKKLGFKVISDQYVDAGILHHDMRLDL